MVMMMAIFLNLFPWLGWDDRHEKNSLRKKNTLPRKNLIHPNILKDVYTWRTTTTTAPPTNQQARPSSSSSSSIKRKGSGKS
jgi:hypothetical protein